MSLNFYAVLPANIRYDKSLRPMAKLLYAEITALCSEKGYCLAPPNYFTEFLEETADKVAEYIKQLQVKGYIYIDYALGDRRIYISNFPVNQTQLIQSEPADKSGYDKFVSIFLEYYTKLTGRMATDIFQVPFFKRVENQTELQKLFENRKYDYKQSFDMAYKVALKRDPDRRFFSFWESLNAYMNRGDDNIDRVNKKKKSFLQKLEEEEQARKEQIKREAEEDGLSVEDYKARNRDMLGDILAGRWREE